MSEPLSVSVLTQAIAGALADFGTVAVRGELSQVKVAPSGHLYATLKDTEAVISLVMWRSSVVRNGPLPKEGAHVVVRGTVSVYGPRGQYQLVATRIETVGAGDLAARFEALRARLTAEGLFEDDRKRPLPLLPRSVGLATAAGSAALADLLDSIRTRFPSMPVVHAPCLVQGAGAATSIVAALERLQRRPDVDVIICGRGGGSLEDLWAFNEEPVVRAIAGCAVPIIAAVGHETDTTLADFAADVRAKTPTAAGELVVPVLADLHDQLQIWRDDLDRHVDRAVLEQRQRLLAATRHRALATPGHRLDLLRQRLDDARESLDDQATRTLQNARARLDLESTRLAAAAPAVRLQRQRERLAVSAQAIARLGSDRFARHSERLARLAAHLDALSPLAVIARGYSVLRRADGTLVRTLADAPTGTPIQARVPDGWLDAITTGSTRQRLNEAGDTAYRA